MNLCAVNAAKFNFGIFVALVCYICIYATFNINYIAISVNNANCNFVFFVSATLIIAECEIIGVIRINYSYFLFNKLTNCFIKCSQSDYSTKQRFICCNVFFSLEFILFYSTIPVLLSYGLTINTIADIASSFNFDTIFVYIHSAVTNALTESYFISDVEFVVPVAVKINCSYIKNYILSCTIESGGESSSCCFTRKQGYSNFIFTRDEVVSSISTYIFQSVSLNARIPHQYKIVCSQIRIVWFGFNLEVFVMSLTIFTILVRRWFISNCLIFAYNSIIFISNFKLNGLSHVACNYIATRYTVIIENFIIPSEKNFFIICDGLDVFKFSWITQNVQGEIHVFIAHVQFVITSFCNADFKFERAISISSNGCWAYAKFISVWSQSKRFTFSIFTILIIDSTANCQRIDIVSNEASSINIDFITISIHIWIARKHCRSRNYIISFYVDNRRSTANFLNSLHVTIRSNVTYTSIQSVVTRTGERH